MATMMQIGRGTYRVERRHLDDPLKPYLAPIRVDLPTFHIAIEYSAEQLPILPPVIIHYPNGTRAFSGYSGGYISPKALAISGWKLEGSSLRAVDVKVAKKRKRVKPEKPEKTEKPEKPEKSEKKVIVREPRRPRTNSITTKRMKSCTSGVSPKPPPGTELYMPLQGHLEPTVKSEPVEHEHHFIPAPIKIFQHTTVIKEEL